jgi:general secretion pathway protein K
MVPLNRQNKEGGFVLLITLLVVLLLVVIIFDLDFQSRADLRAAGNFRDDTLSYYVALSGIATGKAILKDDLQKAPATDYRNEFWAATAPPLPVGEGEVSGKITDESGKFNLNDLVNHASPDNPETAITELKKNQLIRLFELLEVDPHLVDPIIDWIDKNDQTRTHGAENETYQALPSPYETKNGRIDTLDEILFIKGITPEIYQKITPYLTVYPADGKINVNTADALILQSLDLDISESDAKKIKNVVYNTTTDFHNALPTVVVKNRLSNHSSLFSVNSSIFSLQAHGVVHDTKKTIHAVWNRKDKKYLYFKVE